MSRVLASVGALAALLVASGARSESTETAPPPTLIHAPVPPAPARTFRVPPARVSDETAASLVRRALTRLRESHGRSPLREDARLSQGLVQGAQNCARRDSVRDVPSPPDHEADYYYYAAHDPRRLPPFVTVMARDAVGFGVAVKFERTPSRPAGAYWVALALKDPPPSR